MLPALLVPILISTTMHVKTFSFSEGGRIPKENTCSGKDISPSLTWSDVPAAAKSFAVICDDPDGGDWVHWLIWNIRDSSLSTAVPADGLLSSGAVQGTNDFKNIGYGGPCPPPGSGDHHYHFHVYALDAMLTLSAGSTRKQLKSAMMGHILSEAEVVGLFSR